MKDANRNPARPWRTRGRGSDHNPPNRFESLRLQVLEEEDEALSRDPAAGPATRVLSERSGSILARNDSPDIPFDYSLNPYRGCEHGCVYCYARPGHETLGYGCGLDFETRLVAKTEAPKLLRKALSRPGWRGQPIAVGSYTDAYQPIESRLRLTQQCLEVLAEFRQATVILTKSRLILRDLETLKRLAKTNSIQVGVSVTTLENRLSAQLEPRAASPRDRLWTIRRLASAGIPVRVMVSPIIPAINDREIPKILEAAAGAGARGASMVMLRLPHQLKELFDRWLEVHFPDRKQHVLNLLSQVHGGRLYRSDYGQRMTGRGVYAEQIRQTFAMFRRRFGLETGLGPLNLDAFRRPADAAQMNLFETGG